MSTKRKLENFDFVDLGTVHRILGVGRSTAYDLVHQGRIPSYRFNKAIRVLRADLLRYIEDCRREQLHILDRTP